jgi:hypothetical protein
MAEKKNLFDLFVDLRSPIKRISSTLTPTSLNHFANSAQGRNEIATEIRASGLSRIKPMLALTSNEVLNSACGVDGNPGCCN